MINMNTNVQTEVKGTTKTNDRWSGLADFLARMIEKYGESLGLDDLPTPEYVYFFAKRAEVYRKYADLMANKETKD